MDPFLIMDSINFFFTYCYTGALTAHAPGKALGEYFSSNGYYYPYGGGMTPLTVTYYGYDIDAELDIVLSGSVKYEFKSDSDQNNGRTYLDRLDTTLFNSPVVGFVSPNLFNFYFSRYDESSDQYIQFFKYPTIYYSLNSVPKYGRSYLGGSAGNIFGGVPSLPESNTVSTKRLNGVSTTEYVYIPIDPSENYSYEEMYNIIESVAEDYPDVIDLDMLISFEDAAGIETEATEEGCCTGGCNVTVDAEGNVYIDGVQVDLTLIAQAGAFGAGAFGAGAIGQVNINGDIDISGGISGDLNLNGGDVSIDQSGSTITNNYYYYNSSDPVEPSEEIPPFTIDYDEILSEGELESILNQGDYEIETFPSENYEDLYLPEKPSEPLLPVEIQMTPELLNIFTDIISDTGMMPIYFPMGIFSILCYCLRGHR